MPLIVPDPVCVIVPPTEPLPPDKLTLPTIEFVLLIFTVTLPVTALPITVPPEKVINPLLATVKVPPDMLANIAEADTERVTVVPEVTNIDEVPLPVTFTVAVPKLEVKFVVPPAKGIGVLTESVSEVLAVIVNGAANVDVAGTVTMNVLKKSFLA